MRTGAIFARGSCRALKWMALVGMVFALAAGSAAAQATQSVKLEGGKTLVEGGALVPVTAVVTVPAGTVANNDYSVTLTISVDTAAETADPVQERAEILTDADVYWEGTTRGTLGYTFPPGTFRWAQSTSAQTLRATVRMGTFRDTDAEDEKFQVTPTDGEATDYTVTDAETQEYLLTHPLSNDNVIKEDGTTVLLRLEAKPPISGDVTFRVNLSSANDSNDYSLGTATSTAISEHFVIDGTGDSMVDVELNTTSNDVDRRDDTVTLVVLTTVAPIGTQVAELELTVLDQHKLPMVTLGKIQVPDADDELQDAMSIPEGTIGTVTLVADRGTSTDDVPDTEGITVTLTHVNSSTAARADYTLSGSPVDIAGAPGTTGTGTFMVDVDADEDIGEESLVLLATVAGDEDFGPNPDPPYNLAAIAFGDRTNTQLVAKSDDAIYAAIMEAKADGAGTNELWEPGETMSLEASDFFTWDATMYNVVLGNIVSDDPQIATAVSTSASLTVTAVGDGPTEISVTGTAMAVASSLTSTQTVSNVATVKFPVTVDAPMITAKGGEQDVADAAVETAAMASANGIWEPAPNGAVAMVALSDLFDVPDTITAEYLARSSDTADVSAAISADMMNVELTPVGAGMATITVTAVDSERPGNAVTVDFTATVEEQAAVRRMSQDDVNKVFMDAGADDLVAQGAAISVDMSMLFEVGPGVTPSYSTGSSDADVLMASASGTMLMLTPGQGVAGGSATITVTALDRASGANASVEYMAMVDKLPAVLTISSVPMSGGSVEEGDTIMVTATLNQAAAADMSIALDVSGPATGADAIMLATGATSASATLTVNDDNAVMAMPDIVVVASHEAIASGSAVLSFSVTEDDVETTYTLAASAEMVEEGDEVTITATASQPVLEDTTIELSQTGGTAGDGDYGLDTMSITIATGESAGTATLTATDDHDVEGDETLTLQGVMGSMVIGSVMVTIEDNDVETTYGLEVSDATVEEGGEVTITATASQPVLEATMIELSQTGGTAGAGDYGLDTMSITIATGESSGTATLTTTDDSDVEGDETLTLQGVMGGMVIGSVMVTIEDNDVETTYSVTPAAVTVTEGADGMAITATASQAVMANTEIMLMHGASSASEGDYSLDPVLITIMAGDTSASTMLTATDDHDVEGMEMVTLNAMMGDMSVGSVQVTIEDDDMETTYELSASADMVDEGGEVTITATANQMVREDTVVELTAVGGSADADDYSLDPTMLTIAAGETSGSVTLTATDDHDVEGTETLRLQGAVGSMIVGQVLLEIGDDDVETTYTLSASADTVDEGGTVTITATASQMVPANTEVMVMRDGASSAGEDDYSLEPSLITIMEGDTEGSLTLTATDDTDVEGNENLTLNGMVGDMAAGSVMLAIADNDMDITYTLSGPADMNLVEGASAELTATASSAVPMDTEVMIMRDGSSTASDADYTAESIMIMAGETTGTTMVMAVEDNEADSGTNDNQSEMLTLYGMVDGLQTNSVSFYLWDAAVPALPVIAQLLLAAFLAIGGYRRYRRR